MGVIIGVFCMVIIAAIIASFAGGLYLFDAAIARKPPLSNEIPPNANPQVIAMTQNRINGGIWINGNNPERLTVTAGDGIELVGYFIQAAEPASKRLAVLIHGHRSSAAMMGDYGKHYRERGCHVFMADSRGHSESGGSNIGMGWLDRLDYLVWLDLLYRRLGSGTQVVIHGISMGASTALMVSGEDTAPNRLFAIIADCGYSSVHDELKYHITKTYHLPAFPVLNISSLASKLLAGYSYEEASVIEQVRKSNIPTLIIHGEADNYTPPCMAYDIYEAIGGKKELWIVPQVGHANSYYEDPDAYFRKIWAFIGW
jgi:fermentation-respiration switch protein FrsA (DUF1100 family)